MWRYRTPGIPDGLFERAEGVPITKEEIRAIQISKARLSAGDTIYDIGCGSGSVSVEAAMQAGEEGVVLAVDRDPVAIKLTERNAARFGLSNIRTFLGEARDVIPTLPEPDSVIVGGTGGETAEILRMCSRRLRSGGRIVIGTILIETLADVLRTMEGCNLKDADIVQVTILKSRRTSTGTMMLARNPVTIVSASA
ncbi:MAG: precorrin-6Y C5,15-methyltransferase (decarboxylating) subunit CbiT [Nitrosopumilaceae archaeon]|nr:precorrin-6Y C5,15-methyltransferase (decarboxylating) subunit CbiT [Nitrosopumilaceae archaeon]